MRLISTTTLRLHSFFRDIPPYVILSHCWGDGEVTFDDIDKPYAKDMAGYHKIVSCCKQAVSDGFEWAWIDTCAIDKRSSSELSEAINSMYDWYWRAQKCYVYLADTTNLHARDIRWFTRGWTLQELLASEVVEFYNRNWKFIGTKFQWAELIESRTGINTRYIKDRNAINSASIATKFSWASTRQTTRKEDIAYCLLGLVGVNMAMLYGEGDRAFYRLQLEILKKTNEHFIFAWRSHSYPESGLLARSPERFKLSSNYCNADEQVHEHTMTNKGLRIRLHCIQKKATDYVAILNCRPQNENGLLGIYLKRVGDDQYERALSTHIPLISIAEVKNAKLQMMYIMAEEPGTRVLDFTRREMQLKWPDLSNSSYSIEITRLLRSNGASYTLSSFGKTGTIQLLYQQSIGLLFRRNAQTFSFVCFHLADGNNWRETEENTDASRMETRMREITQGPLIPEFLSVQGDYQEWTLSNGTRINYTAVKKRTKHCILWEAAISVSDPKLPEASEADPRIE